MVSLMMVEKVPDSTYEMVGGLDKQIKEIKEVNSLYGYLIAYITCGDLYVLFKTQEQECFIRYNRSLC